MYQQSSLKFYSTVRNINLLLFFILITHMLRPIYAKDRQRTSQHGTKLQRKLKVKEKCTYTQKHRSLLLVLNEDGTVNRKKHEKHSAVIATETHERDATA
jgi:hypothetical protein